MEKKRTIAPHTKIWRYLNFEKYAALLTSESLNFCRVDLLGDKWEGRFSKESIEALKEQHPECKKWVDIMRYLRRDTWVSCWYEDKDESAAQWQLYGNSVAVVSTVDRLRDFLDDENITIEKVMYIDYQREHPEISESVQPFLCKRRCYQHEREIRAILQCFTVGEGPEGTDVVVAERREGEPSIAIGHDLNRLIEEIVVAPEAEKWIFDLVCQTKQRLQPSLRALVRPSQIADLKDPSVRRRQYRSTWRRRPASPSQP